MRHINHSGKISPIKRGPRGGTSPKPSKGAPNKIHKVMHEFKHGTLHSGSDNGPKVKSRAQAIAIGLSEQRKANKGEY